MELHLSDVEGRHRDAAAVVGPGMVFALSDNKAVIGHGGDHIDLGASLRVPQDWITARGVEWSDPTAARTALLEDFADWSPELTELDPRLRRHHRRPADLRTADRAPVGADAGRARSSATPPT